MTVSPYRYVIGHRVAATLDRAPSAPPPPPAAFFGEITMLREVWAEDPSWTNPGDGNALVTVRDNGTLAEDLSAASTSPLFIAAGINGKPSFRFSTSTETRRLVTVNGSSGAEFTVAAILQLNTVSRTNTFSDSSTANNANVGSLSDNTWRGYNGGGAIIMAGGVADTSPHLIVAHFKTNDSTIYIDGTSVATDVSGTVAAATGWNLGANSAGSSTARFMGDAAYMAMCSGDLTADAGYADWFDAITTYYGI